MLSSGIISPYRRTNHALSHVYMLSSLAIVDLAYYGLVLQIGYLWIVVQLLHGPSMFAVKAKIYGVLYNQASSIAFDETSSYWSALKRS